MPRQRRCSIYNERTCILCGFEEDEPEIYGQKLRHHYVTAHENCVVCSIYLFILVFQCEIH